MYRLIITEPSPDSASNPAPFVRVSSQVARDPAFKALVADK
jgi:hypothetical protein